MNILITGSDGQLGAELGKMLSRGSSGLGSVPGAMAGANVAGADLAQLDISNRDEVLSFFGHICPDVVINCAAMTNVDACETEPDAAMRANALGPRNLAEGAEQRGAKLIHISTDYVFSGEGSSPYREWELCAPQSVYGHSKLLGEGYVSMGCRRFFIVRTSWLYGYNGGNFVKTILNRARAGEPLKVVNDQIGNPTNAEDLAYHLLKLAATEDYGIYHCTGNGECSWHDLASEVVRLAGIGCTVAPCTTAEFPRPAKRPAYSALDNMMLRCTVGDEMRDWKDALGAFMENYDRETGEFIVK